MSNMAKLIKKKRLSLRLRLTEVAEATGCKAYQSVVNWETGSQTIPLTRIAGLCKSLKISKKEMKAAYLLDMESKFNKGTK